MRRSAWAPRLLLLAFGVGGALVLAEALLARFPLRPCGGRAPLWRPRAVVGWALVPGAPGEAVVCRGPTEIERRTITINALGQRDRPRTFARTPRVPRVLVLGDSFVEALQVDLDDTFPALLERRLGAEMLNAGVSGYSTDNELRAFAGRGRRYTPDVVLLVFHVGNDVLENGARLYLANPHGLPAKPWLRARGASRALAACLTLHRAAARLAEGVPGILWRGSRLVRAGVTSGVSAVLRTACAGALDPPLVAGVPELRGVYGPPATPGWREAWDTTERLVVRLARRVRASGARVGVAIAPAGIEYDPSMRVDETLFPATRSRAWDFEYPHRRLAALLEREGIPALDLLPALRAHFEATGRSGYHPFDGHWNAEGHRVVADALSGFIGALLAAAPPSLATSPPPSIVRSEDR